MTEPIRIKRKTYKREAGVVILAIYMILLIAGMWFPEAASAAENLKHEAFIFAGGAFTLEVYQQGRPE